MRRATVQAAPHHGDLLADMRPVALSDADLLGNALLWRTPPFEHYLLQPIDGGSPLAVQSAPPRYLLSSVPVVAPGSAERTMMGSANDMTAIQTVSTVSLPTR